MIGEANVPFVNEDNAKRCALLKDNKSNITKFSSTKNYNMQDTLC